MSQNPISHGPIIQGPIIQGPIIQGWCPGALRPMPSGDGLVVRLRPRNGRLTMAQADGIATLSMAHGSGLIDLSNRANLQLRGVRAEAHPALIDGLRDLALVDSDTEIEARRNITVSPFWTQADGTPALTSDLTEALSSPDTPPLPSKFGFAIDLGPVPVLQATPADIRLERGADGLLLCAADAGLGKPVTLETAIAEAMGLLRWFVEKGGVSGGRGRMAGLLARHPLPDGFTQHRLTGSSAPLPGAHPLGQLVGFDFGQMRSETLTAVAQIGPLRVTPWRMLLIEGVQAAPQIPGVITDPADPLLRVIACTGAPGCPQGLAETRPLARALAVHLATDARLHVSGCAKGCAHPAPMQTLVATAKGFDLMRHGTAADAPDLTGLSQADLLTLFKTKAP